MSYDGIGVSDTMLDSLSLQLREAELKRTEADRAHQVCYFYCAKQIVCILTSYIREFVNLN